MIHELDNAVRHDAETRLPRPLAAAPPATRKAPHRRPENARLGICAGRRPIHPAALRVLETTWRVWREPLA